MWLLLVEDDPDLSDSLVDALTEAGYTVDAVADGLEAEEHALTNDYDLMVVDWRLPGQTGPVLIGRLRAAGNHAPILMLTANSDVDSRVQALDTGADDYLTKPFAIDELYARLRALLRRGRAAQQAADVAYGPIRLDVTRRAASVDSTPLDLRAKEFAVLELLVRNGGHVITRTALAERVWGTSYGVTDDVINMTLSSLRRKVHSAPAYPAASIRTLRGIGYQLLLQQTPS